MWTWDQSAGLLTYPDGRTTASGYSGADLGKNNPAMQTAVGVGPIPRGDWRMEGVIDSDHTGPYTIVLDAEPGTDVCGRSAFRIHGDSIAHPGTASHGCIILPRVVREAIWKSGDHQLRVIA